MHEIIMYSTGMMLIHSLWQFTVILLSLKIALIFLRNASPSFRYYMAVSALLFSFLSAIITFGYYYSQEISRKSITALSNQFSVSNSPGEYFSVNPGKITVPSAFWVEALQYIVILYYAVIFILIFRFLLNLALIKNKFTRDGYEPGNQLTEIFSMVIDKLHIQRNVLLLESLRTKIPLTLGYFKPVIIVPAGILMQLPVAQIEAILAHELAHIQRNDFLINLLQSIIETLFFYHPAILLISRYMREEREICCDEYALKLCPDPHQYARALAGIENTILQPSSPALAFTGKKKYLLTRITRILNLNTMKTRTSDRIIAAIIIVSGFITALLTGAATLTNLSGESAEPIENMSSMNFSSEIIALPMDSSDTIVSYDSNRIVTIQHNDLGEKEEIEINLSNGKIAELKVNGKMIPEENYPKYYKLIQLSLEDIRAANQELSKSGEKLEKVDIEEVNRKIEQAIIEARQIDYEKIEHDLAKAKAELKKIEDSDNRKEAEMAFEKARQQMEKAMTEYNYPDSIESQIAEAMGSIDWEAIRILVDNAIKEVNLNEAEINRAMEEAKRAMDEIDWNDIQESVYIGIDAAQNSLNSIDWDNFLEKIELSLDVSSDMFKDLSIDIGDMLNDLEGEEISEAIDSAKAEFRKEKDKLDALEKNMEQALEELEEK